MDWLRSGLLIILLTASSGTLIRSQNPFDLQSRLNGDTIVADTVVLELPSDTSPVQEFDTATDPPPTPSTNPFESPDTVPALPSEEPVQELFIPPIEDVDVELPKLDVDQNVLFGVILIVLLALAILVVLQRSMLHNAYRAVSNDNYLRFLFRDYQNRTLIYRAYYGYFFINAALFVYLSSLRIWAGPTTNLTYLPLILVLISAIYLIRHFVLQVLGESFPVAKETELFGFIIMLVNISIGLIVTPINIGLAFGPETIHKPLIFCGLTIFIFLYLFRQLKGIFISGRVLSGYLFHFFLYFCIVEIAPLLVLGKLATTYIGVH